MKVAKSSTKNAEVQLCRGFVVTNSAFNPYTNFPVYVANIEPPTCATT